MEDWYSHYTSCKLRQQELEYEYTNPHMVRARALMEKKTDTPDRFRVYRRVMAATGRYLQILGLMLQKKYQTC
jgi:hypothetical protein